MRWVRRVFGSLLVLLVILAGFGFWTVRRSFPQTSGDLEVSGLRGSVEVLRDQLGVPHIYASNEHDLFFAQGFVHAQDRFWQMDFWRHIGTARLSEMFGSDQIDTDRFLRSLGWERLAREELEILSPDAVSALEAYAAGVNAYVESRNPAELSLEYTLLPLLNSEYEIADWEPIHTLAWAKVMAWDLGGNLLQETQRAALARTLPVDRVEQLYPPVPESNPVIVDGVPVEAERTGHLLSDAALAEIQEAGARIREILAFTGGGFEGIGSNNWVIGGEHTESGLPLLANDTHLAIQMPSIWYGNGLHCTGECHFDAVGFSFAGTPGVIIGHNAHHAWGVTNQAADTQDLFIERVNPDDPNQYEADGEWVDFETRTEVIRVAGGEDVELEIRSSRHGPIITGTYFDTDVFAGSAAIEEPEDYVVAFAWQALQPSTVVESILGLSRAKNHEEFAEAALLWDIAPQNLVYADIEGTIAYHATGEVPLRAAGDGRWPVPGWTGEFDWIGTVTTDQKPVVVNPPSGFIETANQPVLVDGSTPLIGTDAAYGYRGLRIEQMILERSDHDVASLARMQMDSYDSGAEIVMPFLLPVALSPDFEPDFAALETWSEGPDRFQVSAESRGAALYMATWRHLLLNTFADDLPEDYWPDGGSRWFEVMKELMATPDDPFWDDISTEKVEDRDDVIAESLREAAAELDSLGHGDNATWGDLHRSTFENQTFGQSGIGPIEWLFNRTAPPIVGGSSSVVNAVGWDTDASFAVDWLPSQRMAIDLADFDGSTFSHTTGQSGHAFHPNYDSMIEMWALGTHGPMPWSRDAVDETATQRLLLTPAD